MDGTSVAHAIKLTHKCCIYECVPYSLSTNAMHLATKQMSQWKKECEWHLFVLLCQVYAHMDNVNNSHKLFEVVVSKQDEPGSSQSMSLNVYFKSQTCRFNVDVEKLG